MAVNATVSTIRTTTANLTQANTSQVVRVTVPGSSSVGSFAQDRQQEVVRVTVPGPTGPAGTGGTLGELSDVNLTDVADGSILQYSTTETKWVDQTDISNLGTVSINGGNF